MPKEASMSTVGDNSQMKGDCTVYHMLDADSLVGDNSQMKGDCT